VLTRLFNQGYLKKVVNQNHDCLLQKSGFPQHALNEIHGSWFDPSNPGGNILRDDLFDELRFLEETTDLCLALGTSLSGLNADRLAKTPAKKYPGKGFGLIIVTLQETQLDSMCTLRIFATLDEVLSSLAQELQLPELPKKISQEEHSNNVFKNLPYDQKTGKQSTTTTCSVDLNEGSRIKVLVGSYAGCNGIVGKKNSQGHFNLEIYSPIVIDGVTTMLNNHHLLGSWWFTEAQQGLITCLPVVQDLQ